jgi:hypothetical protein
MSENMIEVGGVVVMDEEWAEYAARTRDGAIITVRFESDDDVETQIWRDPSGDGVKLLCRRGENGEAIPMYRYSETATDPNTETASESAVFLRRLIDGGLPSDVALGLTNQIYSRVPHSQAMSVEITQRIIEQWQNRQARQNQSGQH